VAAGGIRRLTGVGAPPNRRDRSKKEVFQPFWCFNNLRKSRTRLGASLFGFCRGVLRVWSHHCTEKRRKTFEPPGGKAQRTFRKVWSLAESDENPESIKGKWATKGEKRRGVCGKGAAAHLTSKTLSRN